MHSTQTELPRYRSRQWAYSRTSKILCPPGWGMQMDDTQRRLQMVDVEYSTSVGTTDKNIAHLSCEQEAILGDFLRVLRPYVGNMTAQ